MRGPDAQHLFEISGSAPTLAMPEVAAACGAKSPGPSSQMVMDSRISAAESAFAAIWVTVRGRRVALSCLGQSPLIDNGVAAASSKIVLYLGTKPIVTGTVIRFIRSLTL